MSNVSKRKLNASSSSIDSNQSLSPVIHLDKKSRNLSEDGEVTDEIVQADLTESMGGKLNVILQKLEKLEMLDTISANIEHLEVKLLCVEETVKQLESKIELFEVNQTNHEKKCEELEKAITFLDQEVKQNKSEQKLQTGKIDEKVKELDKKLLYLEAYGRRENLIIHGIPESQSPSGVENTRLVWNKFLQENLGIDNPDNLELQRIHRLYRRSNEKPKPIIVRFLKYPDRELVWNCRRKLKGSSIQMFEDFPREITDDRKRLRPILKEAINEGKRAGFSKAQPDKLYIDGKEYCQ